MFVRPFRTVAGLTVLAFLTACVVAPRREARVSYDPPPVMRSAPVPPPVAQPMPVSRPVPVYAEFGRVERIGVVQLASRPTGGGAVLGAVIGAVVGHQFGSGGGRALATGAGAIGGAVVGNAIEVGNRRDGEAYRVQVRFDNGSAREIDVLRIDDLRVGDRVKFEGGQMHRM